MNAPSELDATFQVCDIWSRDSAETRKLIGGVGERFNPAVLKTVGPERVPGVRIPPPPPHSHRISFSAVLLSCNRAIRRRKRPFVHLFKGRRLFQRRRIADRQA